ncbi:MAG: preprotein translocase subunit SecE [Bacteroidota bacterium]|jgi:preprotein translocase subunit SecE|uniref:preprotein translocase subunit SecE n=1 Tax=Candidatus Pollutiaquabacter sp. TaxID=3416354 RepID=UPI001A3A8260|nr:preprotein translocase subunit SecE [Bacteroidota bacterium]MBL7947758.1 preprotein translocase subunit SecE [Bacteroidia bacterium]MBP6010351.1 preprotein translocase subunit SecE [Bacteroidia bacterium]MBP7269795.1 preprotein translocase subunit SecE [Bacteroidia bacterium]MBP7772202.1 preprotein translocase subunit SecE [Bacteroidia bacterium]
MSKITGYIKDSYRELVEKVSWPTWEELQSSVIVVMVATAIIGLVIFLMDLGFAGIMNLFYKITG